MEEGVTLPATYRNNRRILSGLLAMALVTSP